MSTKSTERLYTRSIEKRGEREYFQHVHLYHEMHDDLYHLELEDETNNSGINIVIPEGFLDILKQALNDNWKRKARDEANKRNNK